MSGGSNDPFEGAIDARMRLALERLERRLAPEEIARVRWRVERQQGVLARLRDVPLANADEPATGFDPSPNRSEVPTP